MKQGLLDAGIRAVVLVEGTSDQVALETLARRRRRDLQAEGISIVPMGGATNIGHFLDRLGALPDLALAGLCDLAEEGAFRRGLERVGLGSGLSRGDLEALGFYVCIVDLEDELIRALGADAVMRVIEAQGEMVSFRSFQNQPAQRERAIDAQLRRFMGTRSGRKANYARYLAEALDIERVPRPLVGVLESV